MARRSSEEEKQEGTVLIEANTGTRGKELQI